MHDTHDFTGCIAFSYARFSDPSQSGGHSIERQQNYAPEFCQEFGCNLDTTLTFSDEGKSAFHGKHILEGGGLSRFVACIEAGRVKPNDILIIENLDRMSRLPLGQAEDLLKAILGRGIRIHTRSPWAIYDRGTLNDPMQRMQMIFEFTRSHRESKYKQERLARRWIKNRDDIRSGVYHLAKCPGWLTIKRKDGKPCGYDIVPERAAIVRKIFQLCVDGYGLTAIVKKLNADSVPPFGSSNFWQKSSVSKILNNRAVLGEYQPFSSVKADGRDIVTTSRVATGEPIPNHFPKIVDEKTFEQSQLASTKRKTVQAGAGTSNVVNLFAGMIFDARNGSRMSIVDKGYKPQIVSTAGKCGVAEAVYIPYHILENAFVLFVDKMPLDMIAPKDNKKADLKISEVRKSIESLQFQISKIKSKLRANTTDVLLELLVERDVELKQAQQDLETFERQRGSAATVAARTSKEILSLICSAKGEKLIELRTKLRNELRYWIKRIDILPLRLGSVKSAMVDVELANGEHLQFRASDTLVEWPVELDGMDILSFQKWPKAKQKTSWDVLSGMDAQILAMDDKKLSIELIAAELETTPSVVSRRLIKHGRRRSNRATFSKDREMTWNSSANGWQRTYKGKRYYVGCGTLKELYPRLVKSMNEEGTLKAANRWWMEHGNV